MEGIDKARLLSGLLRARGRYQKARSQTRPFIAYEISLIRKRLACPKTFSNASKTTRRTCPRL